MVIYLQWKPLKGITLGQRLTDSNNRLIRISEWASMYIRYEIIIWDFSFYINMILLTDWFYYPWSHYAASTVPSLNICFYTLHFISIMKGTLLVPSLSFVTEYVRSWKNLLLLRAGFSIFSCCPVTQVQASQPSGAHLVRMIKE